MATQAKTKKTAVRKAPVKKAPIKKTQTEEKSTISKGSQFSSIANINLGSAQKHKWLVIAVLVIAILLVFAYLFKGLFVVAMVNGQPVSRLAVVKSLEKAGGKGALDSMITEMLIFQEAEKNGVSVSNDEINSTLADIEKQFEGSGQSLDDLLKLQGVSRTELVKQITIQKLVEKLLGDKVNVSDEEVNSTFDAQKETIANSGEDESKIRDQIKEQLRQQKVGQEAAGFIKQLKDQAKIQYFVNY